MTPTDRIAFTLKELTIAVLILIAFWLVTMFLAFETGRSAGPRSARLQSLDGKYSVECSSSGREGLSVKSSNCLTVIQYILRHQSELARDEACDWRVE